MITKIVKVDKEHPDEAAIKEAGEILKTVGLWHFRQRQYMVWVEMD